MDGKGDRDSAGDPPPSVEDAAMVSGPDDGERDRTVAGGGEQDISVGCVSIITDGNEESSSLGDGMWEHDRYQQSRRVRTAIKAGHASALEEAWTRAQPRFLKEDLERFMGMALIGTDGEVEVGTLWCSARRRLSHNARGSETMGVR